MSKKRYKEYTLPNSNILIVKDNDAGGRRYFSTETAPEVFVWDTSLVSISTLLAALTIEHELLYKEFIKNRNKNGKNSCSKKTNRNSK